MLELGQKDAAVGERLTAELQEVEQRFTAELLSDLACVNSLVSHVERYRGKMLRPMLVILSGIATERAEQPLAEPHRLVATVMEMVHMATLVHDDILDEAQVRRRGATINHLRGNEAAVMLGDYLISHAYHLCSSLDDQAISRTVAGATNTVCEGELLQLANRNNWELDERTYFEIIRRKTASLCGTCCRLGGRLNGASESVEDRLDDYGQKLGIAFQIVDDLLDLTGDEQTVGKTLGRDLQKGKLTLPLIHYLSQADASQRREMIGLFESAVGSADAATEAAHLAEVRRRVLAGSSVAYARGWAQRLVGFARESVQSLAQTPAKAFLLDMADAVLTRRA